MRAGKASVGNSTKSGFAAGVGQASPAIMPLEHDVVEVVLGRQADLGEPGLRRGPRAISAKARSRSPFVVVEHRRAHVRRGHHDVEPARRRARSIATPSSGVGAPSSMAAIQWQCRSTNPRTVLFFTLSTTATSLAFTVRAGERHPDRNATRRGSSVAPVRPGIRRGQRSGRASAAVNLVCGGLIALSRQRRIARRESGRALLFGKNHENSICSSLVWNPRPRGPRASMQGTRSPRERVGVGASADQRRLEGAEPGAEGACGVFAKQAFAVSRRLEWKARYSTFELDRRPGTFAAAVAASAVSRARVARPLRVT